MLTTLYYFAQVILCSGIMMGYYWLVLRDKKFHQYNRFYLLFAAAVAWIIPLIKIQWEPHPTSRLPVYELFYMVAENNSRMDSNLHRNWFQWNWQTMLTGVYAVVSIILCFMLIIGMIRIARILRKHPINIIDNFFLIITNVQGTPFSFFKYIFWNEQIDLQSESGKQILQHEITHVQQKHSIDKLFVQLVLVAGWFNPFFWLIKGELSMIHEYIADKKSVEHGDTASLAAMLLTAAYPRHPFLLSNPFFFSPIKRRIAMLTNQTKPKYSYLRRLIILPVMAIVLVLFAFRSKESRVKQPISLQGVIENVYNELKPASSNAKSATGFRVMLLKKKYLVVLAPAHGGADAGAKAPDGTKESELALRYAKLIKELNNNDHIEFVLSRTDDKYMHVVEVTDFINNQNPDLAISIHANTSLSSLKDMNGSGVYLSKTGISFNESYTLANNIATNLKDATFNFNGIKTRNDGVYILKNTKCPIVETEIGYLSSTSDLKKLKDPTYQKALASAILQGVQDYLYRKENTLSAVRDTIKKGDSIIINSDVGKRVIVDGEKGVTDILYYKNTMGEEKIMTRYSPKNPKLNNMIYLVDGVEKPYYQVLNLDINDIAEIRVSKEPSLIYKYGDRAKNGVMLFTKKRYPQEKGVLDFQSSSESSFSSIKNKPGAAGSLFIIDGVVLGKDQLPNLNPNEIDNIRVFKGIDAIDRYGAQAEGGAVSIITKKFLAEKGLTKGDWKESQPGAFRAIQGYSLDEVRRIEASKSNSDDEYLQTVNRATAIVLDGHIISKEVASKLDVRDIMSIGFGDFPIEKVMKPNVLTLQTKKGIRNSSSMYSADELRKLEELDAELKLKNDSTTYAKNFNKNFITINTNNPQTNYPVTRKEFPLSVRTVPKDKSKQEVEDEQKAGRKEAYDKVFTETQVPASFPGGKAAWLKYLERNLNIDLPVKKGGPPGTYTVIVQFTVHEDGFLSNIKALNNPGYGTAEEAVRVITKGPKWEPAQQNGKKVASIVKQSITFVISEE
ncbi:MAG: N-acetylmuramoyl-L-alanine amidase [Sediminibacterium sp.]|jgi:N-acetylmuramoyl-L-alanine amidase|nr:N-acetylmuramoyl-L-alanine amidase [Sediminibacterium sp.]MBX9779167.1 N-acetylmuramoyl-L-alanine amidase [Chitinophagaceae bacterium]